MAKVINFPGTEQDALSMSLEPSEDLIDMLENSTATHHTETFAYNDDSYVVLVQLKGQDFSPERMVFMAERLKMTVFGALPEYDDELDPQDDPSDDISA